MIAKSHSAKSGQTLLLAMMLLVIFVKAAGQPNSILRPPAKVFTWFALFALIAIATVLFTSVFFGKPRDLGGLLGLHPEKVANPTNDQPSAPVQNPPSHDSSVSTIIAPTPASGNGPKPPLKKANNSEADRWEHRGDLAAFAAISAEIELHKNYDPSWSITENLSTPFEKINQSWREANYDWQEALTFASDGPRVLRLKDKLDHKKRKTCEQPGAPETMSCYANGTDYDVTDIQGKRESVNPIRRK